MNELLALPREWLAATGEIAGFTGNIVRDVWGLRVFRFFGEALRQSGILIVSSTLIIWALMFILGLECGIEGAYFTEAQGAPAYSGVFTAWCDLREITPYAFGYMMAAKVGTGHRGRARRDADLRGDRRAGGDGHRLDDVPVRARACWPPGWCCRSCTWPGSARPSWPPTSPSCSRSDTSPRAATC